MLSANYGRCLPTMVVNGLMQSRKQYKKIVSLKIKYNLQSGNLHANHRTFYSRTILR